MDGRTREVDRLVGLYDRDLFARRESNGVIHIYRKTHRSSFPCDFVCALTENWQPNSPARDWGLEVLHNRLMAMDLWKDETVIDRVNKAAEKRHEDEQRDFSNNVESFLYDFRRQFARATNDINTSSLSKMDKRAAKGA